MGSASAEDIFYGLCGSERPFRLLISSTRIVPRRLHSAASWFPFWRRVAYASRLICFAKRLSTRAVTWPRSALFQARFSASDRKISSKLRFDCSSDHSGFTLVVSAQIATGNRAIPPLCLLVLPLGRPDENPPVQFVTDMRLLTSASRSRMNPRLGAIISSQLWNPW